ncbi:hypothetical protein BV372_12695 [Nostoc sp. T09]|uniref:WD40 domain-containing protein n=1 Tax=Nostoc sp. T09 TaxID=1932621 RepID=UPI000A3CAF3C|nr:WD40 repeat domain-containing protein [Nostoc sp. T09]OUL34959.1 hypothetical protein BV372_12695 [Nostoc sp. T09]
MRETIETYLTRQAATVGIKVEQITRPLWVPYLSGATGHCLGIIGRNESDTSSNRFYSHSYGQSNTSGRGVALLPGGRSIVTGNSQGQLHCYDLQTGLPIWQSTDQGCSVIKDIACSPQENLLATGSNDAIVRIWDATTGVCLKRFHGHTTQVPKLSWSPDGKLLASAFNDNFICIWDINSAQCLRTLNCGASTWAVDWSPDGQFIASGSWASMPSRIWNAKTGEEVTSLNGYQNVFTLQWSPNGKYVAFGCEGYTNASIYVWNFETHSQLLHCNNHLGSVKCVVWSPNGYLLASTSNDSTIRIWDTRTGKELEKFSCLDAGAYAVRVAWSPDGAFLASSHLNDYFYLWDVRHLLPNQTVTTFDPNATPPLPSHFRLLPTALAQMHRLGIYAPLSLIQDLLKLTGGQPVDNPLAQLAKNTEISELIALRWSAPARIGLVALLLHKIPFPGWEPPSGISPKEISNALQAGLAGEPIEPQAPPPPISLLQEAAKLIDEQLLSLLTILGEQAVAAEPALPLRLLSRIPNLPALNFLQRQLLGMRVCFGDHTGRSIGNTPGAERGQVSGVETSSRTDWSSLLPTQLALPQTVLNYRYQRGELLFRTRELAEPPRLRPTVLLLDVSPPVFGPIEAITRIAAFAVANFLRQADIPVVLISTGEEQEQILQLENPQDLVEIWTYHAMSPANELRSLKLANAIRTNLLDESGLEPIILLLTHPWFGAEVQLSRVPGLRGLFVQYPNMQVKPAIANLCERYSYIDAEQTADLGQILGYLMA